MPDLETMQLDEQLAVRAARARLYAEFADRLGEDTVDAVLDASWDHMDAAARLKAHVPNLAERFARVQLWALARMKGHHEGVPAVVFIDVHDAGRGRMASALFARRTGRNGLSFSAGTDPTVGLETGVLAAMDEVGISLHGTFPKPYTENILTAADVIVTFGDGTVTVPDGTRHVVWPVRDPRGLDLEQVRAVRDDLSQRVDGLADELAIPAPAR